jgi:2-dehydropantoate 2-reductase
MRIVVVGAGAVGAYFGARLVHADRDVTFTARGANLEHLRTTGIAVESILGDVTLGPVRAVSDPADITQADVVLVCVKRSDTRAAVAGLAARLAPEAIVVSLQNGIDAAEELETELAIGSQPRAVAYIGAELVAPGRVRHSTEGRIVVGEPDGRPSSRLERLVETLSVPGFGVATSPAIESLRWKKVAWNAAFNLLCAVTRRDTAGVLGAPGGRELVHGVFTEVVAVARAAGAVIEDDWIDRMLAATERKLMRVRPSTLQDRERGRPLEHDALTGAVVRRGAKLGVATPVCLTLDRLGGLLSTRLAPPA